MRTSARGVLGGCQFGGTSSVQRGSREEGSRGARFIRVWCLQGLSLRGEFTSKKGFVRFIRDFGVYGFCFTAKRASMQLQFRDLVVVLLPWWSVCDALRRSLAGVEVP